jgi:hypothetical protein
MPKKIKRVSAKRRRELELQFVLWWNLFGKFKQTWRR